MAHPVAVFREQVEGYGADIPIENFCDLVTPRVFEVFLRTRALWDRVYMGVLRGAFVSNVDNF